MDSIIELLKGLKPEEEIEADTELLESGILDSFYIIQLMMKLAETFGVEIGPEELLPENFETPEAILALVEKLKK